MKPSNIKTQVEITCENPRANNLGWEHRRRKVVVFRKDRRRRHEDTQVGFVYVVDPSNNQDKHHQPHLRPLRDDRFPIATPNRFAMLYHS